MDRALAERAIADFLRALGRDPDADPELSTTPARVTEAFGDELLRGYGVDIERLIADGSGPASPGAAVVAVTGIDVATVCPHHLMPGIGRGAVVYRPGARLLGLGTIARLVDAFSRRLVLQESITSEVVRALMSHAGARGAYCEITLVHGCLSARGACQARAQATSLSRAGELGDAEVLLALGRSSGSSP